MKKLILGLAALIALTFVACEEDDDAKLFTVDFEDVTLNDAGLAHNDSISGSISSGDVTLTTTWTSSDWGTFNSGFVVSNQTDTTNAGYMNPYSCIAEKGANGSATYAVFYSAADSILFNSPVNLESVMLCNNAYAYMSMLNGDYFTQAYTDGDYFKVVLDFYNNSGASQGSTSFSLASNSSLINEWTELDLSTFKGISYIKFSFESSQTGTPLYFCIDDIKYYEAE